MRICRLSKFVSYDIFKSTRMGDFARSAVIPLFPSLMLLLDRSSDSAAFANVIGAFVFYMEIVSRFSSHVVPMYKDIVCSGPLDWFSHLERNPAKLERDAEKFFRLFSRNYSPSEEYDCQMDVKIAKIRVEV